MTQTPSDEFRWIHVESREDFRPFCECLLPKIRKVAKECGYAVGVHGSMTRDFDLIAVPWVSDYVDKDVLARKIHKAVCGLENASYQWEQMPHGRVATAFPICWPDWAVDGEELSAGHIDLSVVEFRQANEAEIARLRERIEKLREGLTRCNIYSTCEEECEMAAKEALAQDAACEKESGK